MQVGKNRGTSANTSQKTEPGATAGTVSGKWGSASADVVRGGGEGLVDSGQRCGRSAFDYRQYQSELQSPIVAGRAGLSTLRFADCLDVGAAQTWA